MDLVCCKLAMVPPWLWSSLGYRITHPFPWRKGGCLQGKQPLLVDFFGLYNTHIHTYIHTQQPQKGKRVSPPYTLNNMGQRCVCICMYVHICAQTICIASFVQSVPSFVHKTGQSSPTKWDWGPPPPPTKREGVILFLQRPDCCTVQFFCFFDWL